MGNQMPSSGHSEQNGIDSPTARNNSNSSGQYQLNNNDSSSTGKNSFGSMEGGGTPPCAIPARATRRTIKKQSSESAGEERITTSLERKMTLRETCVGSQSLTTFQKQLLVKTWQHLNKTGHSGIGNLIFQKLQGRRPAFKKMFQKSGVVDLFQREPGGCSSFQAHTQMVVELLENAIMSLDNLDAVGQQCVDYGYAHASLNGCGLENGDWDFFGQVLVEAITSLDTIRKYRELVKAWRILASFLVDKLRQGYENGVRRQALVRQKTVAFHSPTASVAADEFVPTDEEGESPRGLCPFAKAYACPGKSGGDQSEQQQSEVRGEEVRLSNGHNADDANENESQVGTDDGSRAQSSTGGQEFEQAESSSRKSSDV